MPCYLVLGTLRSGTSLVAGILHHLGVQMGEHMTKQGNIWNPAGFFVDKEFTWFHEILFQGFAIDGYEKLIERRGQNIWGIKDSRMIYVFDKVISFFPDATKLIICRRHLQHSTESFAARSGVDMGEATITINEQQKLIEGIVKAWNRDVLYVDFNSVVKNPEQEVKRIAEFVGLPISQKAIEFVSPSYQRFGLAN